LPLHRAPTSTKAHNGCAQPPWRFPATPNPRWASEPAQFWVFPKFRSTPPASIVPDSSPHYASPSVPLPPCRGRLGPDRLCPSFLHDELQHFPATLPGWANRLLVASSLVPAVDHRCTEPTPPPDVAPLPRWAIAAGDLATMPPRALATYGDRAPGMGWPTVSSSGPA
jgi:hypothetical protein